MVLPWCFYRHLNQIMLKCLCSCWSWSCTIRDTFSAENTLNELSNVPFNAFTIKSPFILIEFCVWLSCTRSIIGIHEQNSFEKLWRRNALFLNMGIGISFSWLYSIGISDGAVTLFWLYVDHAIVCAEPHVIRSIFLF